MPSTEELGIELARFYAPPPKYAAEFAGEKMRRCYVDPEQHVDTSKWNADDDERWFCGHESAQRGDYSRLLPTSAMFPREQSHATIAESTQQPSIADIDQSSPLADDDQIKVQQTTAPVPPNTEGLQMRKRALIVGVSYMGTANQLDGCSNDVHCMTRMLINHWGYSRHDIKILSEAPPTGDRDIDADALPTKSNIQAAMSWLVRDCQFGDRLFFHYSGHGVRRPDKDGDELDGQDDALVPMDFRKKGVILDDKVNELLVHPLKEGVRLHATLDCCHSGTMMDLPWVWTGHSTLDDTSWRHDTTRMWQQSKGSRGTVIALSGCDDPQESADTNAFGDHRGKQGAMTYCLTHLLELNRMHPDAKVASTYFELVTSMRAMLRMVLEPALRGEQPPTLSSETEILTVHQFADRLRQNDANIPIQIPQLTCSERLDLHAPFSFGYEHEHEEPGVGGVVDAVHLDKYKEKHAQTLQHIANNNTAKLAEHTNTSAKTPRKPGTLSQCLKRIGSRTSRHGSARGKAKKEAKHEASEETALSSVPEETAVDPDTPSSKHSSPGSSHGITRSGHHRSIFGHHRAASHDASLKRGSSHGKSIFARGRSSRGHKK